MIARLLPQDVLPAGPRMRLGAHAAHFDEIDSTNSWLLERCGALPDGTLAWAEHQTAGRGRFQRTWHDAPGASVLLSVLLIEPPDTPLLRTASRLASLAAGQAIEHCASCRAGLRWPNDVMLSGRKVAGVLVESTPTRRAVADGSVLDTRAIVIGVGINCTQDAAALPADSRVPATSITLATGRTVARAAVARTLVERLDELLSDATLRADGWRAAMTEWAERCEDERCAVTVSSGGETCAGTLLRVHHDGDLVLRLSDGSERRFAAETTTRLA